MTQLTVRGFDPELERELRKVAKREHLSLNQAALRLMRKGAGLGKGLSAPIGDALDAFVGCVSADDSDAVDAAVRAADAAELRLRRRGR